MTQQMLDIAQMFRTLVFAAATTSVVIYVVLTIYALVRDTMNEVY